MADECITYFCCMSVGMVSPKKVSPKKVVGCRGWHRYFEGDSNNQQPTTNNHIATLPYSHIAT